MENSEIETLLEQLVARMSLHLPGRRRLLVSETWPKYAAWQATRKDPASWARDLSYLRAFLAWSRVDDFAEVTPAAITEFLTARAAAGRGPKTLNRIREVLHTMFAWFVEQEWLEANPVRRVRRAREPAPAIRALTVPQLDALFAATRPDIIHPIVATIACAGLRRGEAIWLRREDLDLAEGFVRVRARRDRAWQPKTARNRTVPISRRLRTELEQTWRPHPTSEWAFPSPKGCRWDGKNLHTRWRRIMLSRSWCWTMLDLRHTFATQLVARNVSLARVAALMGNSPEICRRHYAHISTEDLRAEVDF